MINVMLEVTARDLRIQHDPWPMHLERTVVAGGLYLQEGDNYELWNRGPTREVTEVTWSHDFQRVRVCLAEMDSSFVAEARDNGWSVRGQSAPVAGTKPYTWRTVPVGTLVPRRGYVVDKETVVKYDQPPVLKITFVPDESAIFNGRFSLEFHPDQEVTDGSEGS